MARLGSIGKTWGMSLLMVLIFQMVILKLKNISRKILLPGGRGGGTFL